MAPTIKTRPETLLKAIQACIRNGERLLDETDVLEFTKPPSSRFYLGMIAQEEFAKAFILFLVREGIVPMSTPVLRAINDHACKQLVGMIMDYMIMHWDDVNELRVFIRNDLAVGDQLPADVGSAIELLRYEKIGRWEASNWDWVEDPDYDRSALRIAEGKKDRRKQDALYVRLTRDGQVCSTPDTISEAETRQELERARRFNSFVVCALGGTAASHRYDKIISVLKILFSNQPKED